MYAYTEIWYNYLMNKVAYPKTLPENDQTCYYTAEFPLLMKYGAECIFHKNYANRMHTHDYYEINLITDGSGLHFFGNKRFFVEKGDFFVIPIHVKHGYIDLGGLSVIHLIITQKFIDDNCTLFFNNKEYYSLFKFDPQLKMHYAFDLQPNFSGPAFDELCGYCMNIVRQQKDPAVESAQIIKSNVVSFLFTAFRCYREFPSDVKVENVYYSAMQNVMQYITEHYAEKINITKLADLSGYSRSSFFRFFKKMTAMSPNDFIDFFRINVAREMLAGGDKNLTDIAQDCGFYDSSHFYKLFKKFTGLAPKKYRIDG